LQLTTTTTTTTTTTIMKFTSSAILACLFAASSYSVDAFSPMQHQHFTPNKSGLMVPSENNNYNNNNNNVSPNNSLLSRLPTSSSKSMKMVAGGAERAYGQEYYEGTYVVACDLFVLIVLDTH
jgi:hypothetical protein